MTTHLEARDHLVLPDAHCYPEDNFRRFEWVSELIIERQPEVIVNIGDWWDMPSLCSYDAGKKSFMDKNVKQDIDSGHKAEKIMFSKIAKYNNTRSAMKKKQYNPIYLKLMGNHEDRVSRMLSYEPKWEGIVSMDSFKTKLDINETICPFLGTAIVDDIAYSHYFVSGVMGRPVSSARALLAKKHMSCTMGHTHVLDSASGQKADGTTARALVCGSFHDKDHEGFGGPQVDSAYWNGIIYKHGVLNGNYDQEELSVERLERMYS